MYLCKAWDVEIPSGGKSCNLPNCLFTRCGKCISTTKKKIKGTQVLHSSASRVQMSLSSNSSSSSLLYGVQKIYIPRTHQKSCRQKHLFTERYEGYNLILSEAVQVVHVTHVAVCMIPSYSSHILPTVSNGGPRVFVMVRPRLQKEENYGYPKII